MTEGRLEHACREHMGCHIASSPRIQSKTAIYDLKLDKRSQKIGTGSKLQKYNLKKLPQYIINNKKKYKKWID